MHFEPLEQRMMLSVPANPSFEEGLDGWAPIYTGIDQMVVSSVSSAATDGSRLATIDRHVGWSYSRTPGPYLQRSTFSAVAGAEYFVDYRVGDVVVEKGSGLPGPLQRGSMGKREPDPRMLVACGPVPRGGPFFPVFDSVEPKIRLVAPNMVWGSDSVVAPAR